MSANIKIIDLVWSDTSGDVPVYNRTHVIDPETTSVEAVAKEGRKLIETHAAFKVIDRDRQGAYIALSNAESHAKNEARRAGNEDRAVKPKELRKAVAAKRELAEDLDLEWEAIYAKLQTRRASYLAAVEHHSPALIAEGKSKLDAVILSLASAAESTRRAKGAMSGVLQFLGGLMEPGSFVPHELRASRHEFGESGAPSVWADLAVENLAKSIANASQILDDIRQTEKRAKAEAEGDDDSLDHLIDDDADDDDE